jgi:glycosyltransferase involved in cell wall biosynthesis
VLPYIEASQSGVIPMAYTYGKPVIATTVGGLPESVVDGCTGYLVPPRDERALAEAILELLNDPSTRHRMGVNGQIKLKIENSAETVAAQTLEVYAQALNHSSNRVRA